MIVATKSKMKFSETVKLERITNEVTFPIVRVVSKVRSPGSKINVMEELSKVLLALAANWERVRQGSSGHGSLGDCVM